MKQALTILIICLFYYSTVAQDVRFSQYLTMPLLLNPALTGVTEADYRFSVNHRSQWTSFDKGYRTTAFSIDAHPFQFQNEDYFNVGLLILNDKAGDLDFQTNSIYFSMGYSKVINRTKHSVHYVTLGFLGGYLMQSFDPTAINSLDPIIYDLQEGGARHLDIAAGGLWFYSHQNFNIYAGFSAYHLNKPINSFELDFQELLARRQSFHLGGMFHLRNNFSVLPSLMYEYQNQMHELIFGAYMQFGQPIPTSKIKFYVGTWYRWQDSMIISYRMEYDDFVIVLSYDANVSSLAAVSRGFGALEFSLQYQIKNKPKRKKHYGYPKF